MTILIINPTFVTAKKDEFSHYSSTKYALEKGMLLFATIFFAIAIYARMIFAADAYTLTFKQKFFVYGAFAMSTAFFIAYLSLKAIPYSEKF